jgi:hypothetical protein
MLSREEAIAIALRLSQEEPRGRQVATIGDVFTHDNGQTWTVHLVPEPLVIENKWVAFDTPGIWIVSVSSKTGCGKWVETY